ncbi:LPS-assembly protein LptD [Shimia ponticola]|uniref:LPS-assembly protein LptD n=1 Tax=Shimia ponticola TaxID=2582893 RepID=UPI00164B89E3|nr:LPS assembly protein LptD [Shimia ponticola]
MRWRFFACLAWALLLPFAATAQSTLVADRVTISGDEILVVEGNVEIFDEGRRLTTSRLVYDGKTETLTVEGPVTLEDGEDTVIMASGAELNQDLQTGIMRGARMIIDNAVQVSAVELQKVDDRYTQAYKIAATSCHICENRAPIWHIRAKRVVHDTEEKQLYFDQAQIRLLGVPILYLPRMRLPDPTLTRATGFLIPRLRFTSELNWGIKIPYFVRLGDHADLTFTPYLSSETRTLETRYRQAFVPGEIEWNVSLTNDELTEDEFRWAIFGEGRFDLIRDYQLTFDVELSSDDDYTDDYGITSKDRLDSEIAIRRTRRNQHVSGALVSFHTLRESESNATQPTLVFDVGTEQRFYPEMLGGQAYANLNLHSRYRTSDDTVDADGDGLSDGLDVSRISATLGWSRRWTSEQTGLVFDAGAELGADLFWINQDPAFDQDVRQGTSAAALALSYPVAKRSQSGTVHTLTPRVQLAWSETTGKDAPNEDSTRVEFDEGNLFRFNRSPGFENTEVGGRVNLGLTWDRATPSGMDSSLTLGRVVRLSGDNDFSVSSGLRDDNSDWLISGQFSTPNGIDLLGRLLVQDDLSVTKNEIRADWTGSRASVSSAFAYLRADPDEDRDDAVSELTMDADYRLNDVLTASGSWRYDWNAEQTSRAGLGLAYENECLEVDFSVSRRFSTSANVDGSTEFSWSVGLKGFGTSATENRPKRACRG